MSHDGQGCRFVVLDASPLESKAQHDSVMIVMVSAAKNPDQRTPPSCPSCTFVEKSQIVYAFVELRNPFDPSAHPLPGSGFLSLKLYDILGREVRTLVNDNLSPGSYQVMFSAEGGSASGGDATGLASGVYVYRLSSGNFTQTKRMMLLR
jgi:hypothetical protein